VYHELLQHSNSKDMKFKEMKKLSDTESDRAKRINDSLEGSDSAEAALLKSSSYFIRDGDVTSGLGALIAAREKQFLQTKQALKKKLIKAAALKKRCGKLDNHYEQWSFSVRQQNFLGDPEATQTVGSLIRDSMRIAGESPGSEKEKKELRALVQELRVLSETMTSRMRALRYIEAVQKLQSVSAMSRANSADICHCERCDGSGEMSTPLMVNTLCGHIVCCTCLDQRPEREEDCCAVNNCTAAAPPYALYEAEAFAVEENIQPQAHYGKRLQDITSLIHNTPKEDQVVMFVQNYELMSTTKDALRSDSISYHAVEATSSISADQIEDFQENSDQATRKKVLLLNLADESAAGVYVSLPSAEMQRLLLTL